ncbi:MAG: discoidin domain-containing protein [Anaerolineae bacterium]|nr:discoidin domain-containing protein [Anaerolineae bacterium]
MLLLKARHAFVLGVFVLLTVTCNLDLLVQNVMPRKRVSTTPTLPQAFTRLNLVAEENGGRVVSTTDEDPDFPASNLIDGCTRDYCQWWSSEPPQFPQIIVFALANEQVKPINQVVLNAWASDWRSCRVKDFEVWVSASSSRFSDMKKVGAFTLNYVGLDQTFTFDPVLAKYIALVIKSNYGGEAGTMLNEFEVYEAPPNTRVVNPGNLVAAQNGGRIVAFSSEDPSGDWSAINLIDGDKESPGWSSEENLNNQYVVFAFKGNRLHQIDRVILNPYSTNYQEDWIKDFELRVSETTAEPKAMQSIGRFRLERVGKDQSFTFPPVRARYIALMPLTNYGGTAFSLNEFEVYAVSEVRQQSSSPQTIAAKNSTSDDAPTPQLSPEVKGTLANLLHQFAPRATVERISVESTVWDIVPYVYHLYGTFFDSMTQVTLKNQNAQAVKVRVEATVTNYTETGVKTVTVAPNAELVVELNPPLLPGVMERLTEAKSASLHVKVEYLKEGERRLIYEETIPTKVWSQGDVLLQDPRFHNPFIFEATLVTPADPTLDRILRNATKYAPGGVIIDGYGTEGDKDGKVYGNLKAIYRAVADDGVIYVSAGIPFLSSEEKAQGYYMQRIKLPYQVLATRSGMCIETSLLFASLYEKIGLDPIIIRMPGHAFLAVPVSKGSATYYFIETTWVGRASFETAINSGAKMFKQIKPYLAKDRRDNYFWLDISAMRQEGILPIPWR